MANEGVGRTRFPVIVFKPSSLSSPLFLSLKPFQFQPPNPSKKTSPSSRLLLICVDYRLDCRSIFAMFMDAPISDASQQPNKRRKLASGDRVEGGERKRWRTEVERQIYSSKLAAALRRVGKLRSSINGNLIRETADCVLAASAKGRTRWSRAILAKSVRQSLARRRRAKKLLGRKPPRAAEAKSKKLAAVQRKVKILGRLVPGCRKVSFPNLLEETSDYISALEMQVRAMAVLVELLAGTQSNLIGISNDS